MPRLRRDDGLTQVALVALLFSVALAGAAVGVGARALFDDEGVESSAAAARAVSILAYDCPGGEPIAEMTGGDRLFLMARYGDGDGWLRTRDPRPPHVAWWILASAVDPDAPASTLPEAACGDELPDEAGIDGTVESTEDPATTTTALDDTTTSTTTSAPGTTTSTLAGTTTTTAPGTTTTTAPDTTTTTAPDTTTTTAPDTTPPTIASKSATPDEIWEQDGLVVSCPSENDRQSTISAVVTDNFGVMSVTASWSDPDGIQNAPMSVVGSNYTSTFGPYPAGEWDPFNTFPYDHSVTITITARDAAGNKSSTTVSVTVWEIGHCLI
ncbi:MAG: hypothetical protein IH941_10025 [Acidobacteria bacterium]|nr:hypothetical protein [Acidobacteriota bacterium]